MGSAMPPRNAKYAAYSKSSIKNDVCRGSHCHHAPHCTFEKSTPVIIVSTASSEPSSLAVVARTSQSGVLASR